MSLLFVCSNTLLYKAEVLSMPHYLRINLLLFPHQVHTFGDL